MKELVPVFSRQHFSLAILKERIDTLHGEVRRGASIRILKTKSLYLELINVLLDLCSKGSTRVNTPHPFSCSDQAMMKPSN